MPDTKKKSWEPRTPDRGEEPNIEAEMSNSTIEPDAHARYDDHGNLIPEPRDPINKHGSER